MNYLLLLSLSLILFSCSQKDEKFCACIKESESLNTLNQKILRGDIINTESIKEVKDQINRKKDACKDYEYMIGSEMLELKKSCE
ncbi:MAG: hypothetical protein EBS12_02905 [Flavobacteriia bacterium]|nr:hypothetical protein [Flavobacteriia bacterium]